MYPGLCEDMRRDSSPERVSMPPSEAWLSYCLVSVVRKTLLVFPIRAIRNVMHAAPSPRLDHPVTKGRGVSRRIDTNGAFRSPPLGSLLGHFGTKSPNWTRYSEGVSP